MTITIDTSTLKETVKRSLSIIGKRSVDDKGNLLFKDITVSSNEEPILLDFFNDASLELRTQTDDFIKTNTTATSINVTFPANHNSALDQSVKDAFSAYCVSYALYSWFVITAPKIAAKYQEDARRNLGAVIRLAYSKQPPS